MTDSWAACYMCNHIFHYPTYIHRHRVGCPDSHWDHFETWRKKFKIGGMPYAEYDKIGTRTKQRIHNKIHD